MLMLLCSQTGLRVSAGYSRYINVQTVHS